MRFSIIVPVYNVEKYLSRCIDSVLCQTCKDHELILCDDGSQDTSGALCDRYLAENPTRQIRVFHDGNGGLSVARNRGLDAAKGDYILFLDSDDYYLDNTFLERLAEKLDETAADVVFFGALYIYPDGTRKKHWPDYDADKLRACGDDAEAVLSYLLSSGLPVACAWNKCYRASFLRENDIRFPPGVVGEDMRYNLELFLHRPRGFAVLDGDVYAYRQKREGQITAMGGKKPFDDVLALIADYTSKENLPMRQTVFSFLAFEYAILMMRDVKLTRDEKREFYSYAYLLSYATEPKSKKVYRLTKLLGMGGARRALHLYRRIRRS